ncbi:MAG TPA: DUF4145 domain-containing protein [Terriglobales bacterium]|nr:DUF4145 domain-containing protein [Terriglobales bacterium]
MTDNRKMDTTHFPVECRHCGNKGRMDVLAEKSLVEDFEDNKDAMFPLHWEAGHIYQILRCCVCNDITVYQVSVHSGMDPEYIDRDYDRTLYPCDGESPMGLPLGIQSEWDAALRVRRINQNAFAVLLGRVLDAICIDQKAEGSDLNKRIEHLVGSGKLPSPLRDVAHGLRKLRNFGAHGNYGDLDPKDAPLLESLCRAVLMYLYTVPTLTRDAQKRLEKS